MFISSHLWQTKRSAIDSFSILSWWCWWIVRHHVAEFRQQQIKFRTGYIRPKPHFWIPNMTFLFEMAYNGKTNAMPIGFSPFFMQHFYIFPFNTFIITGQNSRPRDFALHYVAALNNNNPWNAYHLRLDNNHECHTFTFYLEHWSSRSRSLFYFGIASSKPMNMIWVIRINSFIALMLFECFVFMILVVIYRSVESQFTIYR